jgi:peptidyl-prolyl cis-trans isomerase D
MVASKVQELVRSGVHVSDGEVADRFRYDNERVNLRYIRVPAANFRDGVTLTDADVQQYFADNQEQYRQPERIRIKLVEFKPQDFTGEVTPTDADIQAYYDSHQEDYDRDEEARARHILFKIAPDASDADKAATRAKAEEVLAKAKAGEDFIALAKQYSEDVTGPTGGDLGVFGRGVMTPAFETAVFAMEPNQISDIVETPFGLHIVKLEQKHPARIVPLEEVRPSIVELLKTQQSRQHALEKVEKAHEQLLEGAPIDKVATDAGVTVQTPSPFGRNEAVGAGMRPELVKQVYLTEVGEVGEIVNEPTGYSLFSVEEVIPTAIPELSTVREKVEADLRSKRASEAAKQRAEQLLQTLKANPDIDALAQQSQFPAQKSEQIGRAGSFLPDLGNSAELKEAAFKLTEAAPVAPAVYMVGDDAVVAVLAQKIPADETKLDTDKKALRDRLQQQAEASAMQRFVDQLKSGAKIQYGSGFGARGPAAAS